MTKDHFSHLPKTGAGGLASLPASEIAAAYIASHREGCSLADASAALSDLCAAAPALDEALRAGLIRERGGVFHAARPRVAWAASKRDFAFRALGVARLPSRDAQRDLAGAALRFAYALENLPPCPSRAQARSELLRRVVASFGERLAAGARRSASAFSFDPVSRSIYLAFAGLSSGSVLQADAALLSSAFGGPASTTAELSTTIIRASLRRDVAADDTKGAFDLVRFADSVRKLAGKLETKPYAGRVAIAQVYDAGLAKGLDLGTLDDFKSHVAEAAREGLIDLERYDIAGPFDASLKERSRLRLGRDERHFIVNQWI